MGLLVDGVWYDKGYDTESHGGQFEREPTTLRSWITADGSPGPSGEGGFRAERGRYHLYVSYACPWAHRTIICVYRCGFASRQDAYEKAFKTLFDSLDAVEKRLERHRYLTGDTLTEADWRLFVTLVRFDPVYVGHFKCNLRRIADYPNLSNYTRELYQNQGVAETVRLDHIKTHYYRSHPWINPTGIVPLGPEIDYSTPHDRAQL
jgi:glutathionyl-hydroquinone reductase